MTADLAVTALRNAVTLRAPAAAVVHSPSSGRTPSSTPYAITACTAPWAGSAHAPTTPQWSRSFSLLQKNVLNRQQWTTRDELRLAIIVWIEKTYDRRLRQDRLGRLASIEYETLLNAAHAA